MRSWRASSGSNLLVTGTVQGNDSRISIIIKLEDPIARKTIWSKEYPGSLNDLLTMQEQMFSGLVDALNITPSSEERAKSIARPTQNIAAYDSYLKGRNALRGQQDRQNIEAAMNFFNDALRQDPRFALAFAGLSDASVAMYHDSADTKWATQAVYTAQQAERLDDSLVEVHAAMGQAYVATGRTNEAIVELRRALEIAPNSDEAYRRLAAAYRIAGQTDEAIKMHKLAIDKNPYYWINHNALGYTTGASATTRSGGGIQEGPRDRARQRQRVQRSRRGLSSDRPLSGRGGYAAESIEGREHPRHLEQSRRGLRLDGSVRRGVAGLSEGRRD